MQGQRAEPDQERENKHDRSQQDFQNELHIFINSFAYILQFNRSRGKDAAERDGIGAAAPLFDACKLSLNVKNGVIELVAAFLLSPYGLPMLGAWLVAQLHLLRDWMKEKVYW